MQSVREKHSITMSSDIWKLLEILKRVQGRSISEILEEAVRKMVKNEGYNLTYFKIMSSTPYCDDEENKELTRILDSLTEDDLEVVEEYEI